MRLFVAADLDDASRDAIHREQRRVARAIESDGSSLKWVNPAHMHITLAFLGEIPEAAVPVLASAVARDVDQDAFTAAFGQLGVFPSQGVPRILWLGIGEGARELAALQRMLADRLRDVGVATEDRPFSAHLTLARWRDGRRSDRGRVLASSRPETVARVLVDHATLYRSELSSAGPTYTALARATLKACPPS